MFRVIQTDPETSAIHINAHALLRHKQRNQLLGIIEVAMSQNQRGILSWLAEQADSQENAVLISFYLSFLHELRHYADLLLTPYGFYRLRVAFEFYQVVVPFLSNKSVRQIPVPLMSGADPINQELLGLVHYKNSFTEKLSYMMAARSEIIAADNRSYAMSERLSGSFGGDSILEALAATLEIELARNLFDTPWCQQKMPHMFGEYADFSAGTFQYTWQYLAAGMLKGNSELATMRLLCCILFASLCGSFACDAKYEFRTAADFENLSTEDVKSGRFVDELLPSHRLLALYKHFKQNGVPDTSDWQALFSITDATCKEIWGKTIGEEILTDLKMDEYLFEQLSGADPLMKGRGNYPIWAMEDLLSKRRELYNTFLKDPIAFVGPFQFMDKVAPILKPLIVHNFPQGVREHEISKLGYEHSLFEVILPYIYDGEEKSERISYSFLYTTDKDRDRAALQHIDAWRLLISSFAPFYKLLLYGNKYRSMLEVDTARSVIANVSESKLVRDSFYNQANDVSNSQSYFEFYDLDSAECDVCSKMTVSQDSLIVSGLTIRQNDEFVDDYIKRMGDGLPTYEVLVKDWSVWLLCNDCARQWGFRELSPFH